MSWNPQGMYDVEVDYLIGKRLSLVRLDGEVLTLNTKNGQTFRAYHIYNDDEEVEALPPEGDIQAFLDTIIANASWEETNQFEKSGDFEFCKYRRLVLINIDGQEIRFTWFMKNTDDETLYIDFFVKDVNEVPEEAV